MPRLVCISGHLRPYLAGVGIIMLPSQRARAHNARRVSPSRPAHISRQISGLVIS